MKILVGLSLVLTLLFGAIPKAEAVNSSATAVVIQFSVFNAFTSAWLTVTNSTSKALKGITVLNYSPVPLELAIGASSAEVVQLVLPSVQAPGTGLQYGVQPVFYPIPISQGSKIAVRARNSTAATGELQMNQLYY